MLKILIGVAVAYLLVGLVFSRKSFGQAGVKGSIFTVLFWPAIAAGLLFAGRWDKKKSTEAAPVAPGSSDSKETPAK